MHRVAMRTTTSGKDLFWVQTWKSLATFKQAETIIFRREMFRGKY